MICFNCDGEIKKVHVTDPRWVAGAERCQKCGFQAHFTLFMKDSRNMRSEGGEVYLNHCAEEIARLEEYIEEMRGRQFEFGLLDGQTAVDIAIKGFGS